MSNDGNEFKSLFLAFIDFFMESESLRNFMATILYILAVYIVWKGFLWSYSFSTSTNFLIFFSVLIGTLIASIISACLATRLAVMKVCPNCHENRALVKKEILIDRHETPQHRPVDNNKRFGEQEWLVKEEYVSTIGCKYCSYYEESESYLVDSWERVE